MRSLWTGQVTISLINMPVKLGSAVKDNQLGLKMVRKSDGSPIKFTRLAEKDGEEVAWSDIGKGYYAPDGSLVVLGKEDFETAYGPKNRTASILMFTDASNIPPMAAKTAYWVQPDKGGEKAYALIASALQSSKKVAVLTFAMREREAVAVLRPHDGYLSIESLEWDADLVKPDFTAPPQTASEDEQELAGKLIAQMTDKYDHTAQADKSTEALQAVIQAKIEKGDVIAAPARPDGVGTPVDLSASLLAAVEAQKPKEQPAAPRQRSRRAKASA